MTTYINNKVAITYEQEHAKFEADFKKEIELLLGETVTITTGDRELGIRAVLTVDGIRIMSCNNTLFTEDFEHGADWEELENKSVLKANIEWLRNARKAI
jgi:hypothetical protein